jgi:GR25 family glycosyltransferase involved in LPS biosynthesis
MHIQCLIIHLERAHERRAHIEKMIPLIKMETKIIDAVDVYKLSQSDLKLYNPGMVAPSYHSELKASEIACFLSHRKSWQHIVENKLDAALVLEDDAEISEQLFRNSLSLALENITEGDFIRFPIKKREEPKRVISKNYGATLFEPVEIKLGMVAQLITRDAAQALIEATESMDRPVDCFLQMRWLHNVRVLTAWPSGIDEVSSTLGGSMINHKVNGFAKLKREIMRTIYRYKISKLSKNS